MVACDSVTRDARLLKEQAELMLETHPDSTLMMIDSIMHMEARLFERERMDLALLQGKALYDRDPCDEFANSFIDEAVTLPELDQAPAYFASKKDYCKAALTALYYGYASAQGDDRTAAMNAFKDAERFGALAGDSLTSAKAQYNMGQLLYYDGMEEEAIKVLKVACLGLQQHPAELASALNVLACCHMLRHEYDSAEFHLKNALEKAEQAACDKARRKVLNNLSVISQLRGDLEHAIYYLKQIENVSDSTRTPLTYLMNLGIAYDDFGMTDSAAYYYKLMEAFLPTTEIKAETKASAFLALSRFSEKQDDYSKALEYRNKYERTVSELQVKRERKKVYAIQQKYNYNIIRQAADSNTIRNQRIIAILGVFLIILLLIMLLVYYRYIQKDLKEAETNALLLQILNQNSELIHDNEIREKDHREMVQALTGMLTERLKTMQKLDVFLKDRKNIPALTELEKLVFGGKEHWGKMLQIIDSIYPGLYNDIKSSHPELSELECRVFLLSRFNLSRLDEAMILGISISVLDKVRGRIRRIIETADVDENTGINLEKE